MSTMDRLPRFMYRLFHFLPPRLFYSLGLGFLVGHTVLLLTTEGRKSGLPRVTPLLYDEIDGMIFVGSMRGAKADWYQNLQANPTVELRIGSRNITGRAEAIEDPQRIADFLEKRLELRPFLARTLLPAAGLRKQPSREQIEAYANNRTLAAIRPAD